MALGVELWSTVSSDVQAKEAVYSPKCPVAVATFLPLPPCPIIGYANIATGSRPNHLPAALALLIGSSAGAAGLIIVKPRRAPTAKAFEAAST
jgi:hypothetical protein